MQSHYEKSIKIRPTSIFEDQRELINRLYSIDHLGSYKPEDLIKAGLFSPQLAFDTFTLIFRKQYMGIQVAYHFLRTNGLIDDFDVGMKLKNLANFFHIEENFLRKNVKQMAEKGMVVYEDDSVLLNQVYKIFKGITVDQCFRAPSYYYNRVRYIAKKIAYKLPIHVDNEDLVSPGIEGLLDAFKKFDITKNASFDTYSSFRVRGAILDHLRAEDVIPRSLRSKKNQFERTKEALNKELKREPTSEEMAVKLGVSLGKYYQMEKNANAGMIISIDSMPPQGLELLLTDDPIQDGIIDPTLVLLKKEEINLMRNAIDSLPSQENAVMNLYHLEELTMKRIGELLGYTEGRISQLHTKAMTRFRKKFIINARRI